MNLAALKAVSASGDLGSEILVTEKDVLMKVVT